MGETTYHFSGLGSVELINSTWKYAISADCNIVDPKSLVVEDSQLPAEHGTEITYTCLPNHAKTRGNIKAICQDGKIASFPEETSHCSEFSKFDFFIYKLLFSCNASNCKDKINDRRIKPYVTYDSEPIRAIAHRPFC